MKTTVLFSALALSTLTSAAIAGERTTLTDGQMDGITAGAGSGGTFSQNIGAYNYSGAGGAGTGAQGGGGGGTLTLSYFGSPVFTCSGGGGFGGQGQGGSGGHCR